MKDTNLIIGKKNTGKTTGILWKKVKESIQNNENLCIFNTRDEYYKGFSQELKETGYNVFVINLQDVTKSNGYNPLYVPYLLYKEGKLDKSLSLVNDLALEIFKADHQNADPFWENMASNYFTGLVSILFKEATPAEINLGSIQMMMNQGELKWEDTTYLKKYLETVDAASTTYALLSPTVFAPTDTRGSIIAVAKQKLNVYMLREQLLNLLNTNEVNITELSNKTAILMIGNEETNDIANMFIDQLVETSSMRFTYILDNFDELRRLLSFNNLIKNATYNGNKVYVAVHNEEELKEKYGKYILDSFEVIINQEDIKNLSQEINSSSNLNLKENCDYPSLQMNAHDYMNLKKLIDERYK